jgi:hypothetical protein
MVAATLLAAVGIGVALGRLWCQLGPARPRVAFARDG